MHWRDYVTWALDGILVLQIVAYGFLFKAMVWRYRDTHRLHMAVMAGIQPVHVNSPWYVKGVDKLMSRWLN